MFGNKITFQGNTFQSAGNQCSLVGVLLKKNIIEEEEEENNLRSVPRIFTKMLYIFHLQCRLNQAKRLLTNK